MINIFYGNLIIEKNKKANEINLNFIIKIISPKIEIDRFFQNENPEKIILDLVKLSEPNHIKETIFIFPENVFANIYLENLINYNYIFSENYSEKHKIILGINSYSDSKIFNSMVVLDNNLKVITKYNKNKLVPFGEFLPFENLFTSLGFKKVTQGYQSYAASNKRDVINVNSINFLPLICYEIIYSGNINKNDQNFQFILNISEDGWFGNSIGPYQHFSHSIFRAIEEGKNLIRSTNNGISAFINSKGQIISKIKTTERGFIEIKSFKDSKKTFFSVYGNKIFFYFLLLYITLFFFLKKKRR
jgi:apolipoprotein N-acyltransferase